MKMADASQWEDESCSICFDSNQFRVLQCGHAFCLDCLQTLYNNYSGKVPCPLDRREDTRAPHTLPTPQQFQGQLFVPTMDDERYTNLNQLIDAQVQHRLQTIAQLRNLASTLGSHEFNCAIAKISGSAAGVVGSIMTIVGLGLTFTGVGAIVGVPLALTGAGTGIAGGATAGITVAVEQVLKDHGIKDVQKDLILDYFKSEQIKVLLTRAAQNPQFARRWQINSAHLISAGNILPGLAKLGVTTAAGVRIALGIGRAATTTGLHVAGLVLAAAVIPLDLAQMIVHSIKIHKKEASQTVKDIMHLADRLEKELRIYLIEGKYFKFLYTIDGHWAYIAVYAEKLKQFNEKFEDGFDLAQLKRFGNVVEYGEGEVPSIVQKRIQDEWFLPYDELIAQTLEQELKSTNQ